MLSTKNLKLAYGSKVLVEDATIQLYKGQRVGLVGQNGAGKTSLFKMILGQLAVEAGDYFLNNDVLIGYVEQEIDNPEQPIVDYILSTHPLIRDEQTDLPEYYQLQPNAEKMLISLGFSQNELYLPINQFSGGWQMRANLAKALLIPSDLLLLDEPTNHLDIETVIWLEDWLKRYTGLAIIISHDREFLDNVTTHTLLLQHKTLTLYTGGYSIFENTRHLQLQQQQQMLGKQQAKIAHLQSFVDRFKAKASKAKQAQSRMKMIEKLQVAQSMPRDVDFSIEFLEPEYQVDKLLSIHDATVGYPNRILINNAKLDIFQNSRIGLLGRNGMGKTTLIRALIDGSTLLKGDLHIDRKIKVGYFAQQTVDQLDPLDTPLGFFMREHKTKKEGELRAYLGGYGFGGDKVFATIGQFSGGEKARLTIANIIYQKPNVLFLDEPTNHLDMQMREELANGLQDFAGGVVIVSHDKFLLQSVVDEYYLIKDNHLECFNGDLEDYHKMLLMDSTQTASVKKNKPNKLNKPNGSNKPNKLPQSKQEQATDGDIKKIEEQMVVLNHKISEIELAMTKLDLSKLEQVKQLDIQTLEYNSLKQTLSDLEDRWLSLNSELGFE